MEENEEDIPYLWSWSKTPKNWNTHLDLTPTEPVDPEEFWKDEPDKADGYANVYIPKDDFYEPDPEDKWVTQIKPGIKEWLDRNAGERRAFGLDWYQRPQDYDWYVRGETTHKGKGAIQVCVRDPKMAMFLKLKFGGL